MAISARLVKEVRERTGAGMMECKKALVETDGDIDAAIEALRIQGQAKADKKADRVAAEGLVAVKIDPQSHTGVIVEVNCETDFVAKKDEFREFVDEVANLILRGEPRDVQALATMQVGGRSVEENRRDLIAVIGENITIRRFARLESTDGVIADYVHNGRIGVLVSVTGGDEQVARDLAMHVSWSNPLCLSEQDVPEADLRKEKSILEAQAADSGKPPEIVDKMVQGRLRKYLEEVTLLGQPFVKDPDLSVAKFLSSAGATANDYVRFEVGEGIEKKDENFAEEVMAQVRETRKSNEETPDRT